jgi:hypothetical protein
MENYIILVRDHSELSNDAENYIKSLNKPYLVYYSDTATDGELPVILYSLGLSEYRGDYGLNLFKEINELLTMREWKLKTPIIKNES